MEMNRTELAAVNGVACDLLDARGRLVVTPNALTLDGQRNVPADLRPGETLEAFLGRHVPGIDSGAWAVMIGGAMVPRAMWKRTWPKHGQLIACRASVGKQVVAIVAIAVLSYFTLGAGATLGGSLLGINGVAMVGAAGLAAVNMGIFMVGSALINKVLGPKVPKPAEAAAARQIYSLSSQRNSARAYEPLPVLWGEMRVTPDLAGQPYTWFEGDDQYLSTILLGGVNVHSAADLAIGDTQITSFDEVSVFCNGFSGVANQEVPLYGNADSIPGAELENDGPWVTRTSSAGSMALQVDIEGQLFDVDNKGNTLINSVPLFIETRPVGGGVWQAALSITLANASNDVLRRTYTLPVVLGQHEVRVRLGQPRYNEGDGKDACKLVWNVLKSIQPDATDYSAWGRIGIKIKATGQLSGGLDTLRATYRARPIPLWNGVAWVTASTREEGLSNPGAILLQALRGVYANGVLQFGFGMQDEQIDIEGLKAFMLHCTARGYRYDRWVTGSVTLGAFCQEVALAGMGEFSWTDGSRPTAVFVGSGQPLSGVVNMANMLKGSFSVAYSLSNAADGIEYQYLDRDRNWETQTLRVTAPGVTTMLNPARITGDGVTTEAHAAVLARYHLAQSLFQYKTIDYGADIEHLAYRRLSVLSISHDLTQWGFGGRVMRAERVAGKVVLQLDEPVPPLADAYVGLRVPGARDYRVFKVELLNAESDQITLVEAWPAGVKFPGEDLDNPAHDTLWCYDFKATPGYRVRVVGMEPEADLKGAKVSCVPEGPEFWDYVLNGTYTPAPNQSSLPQLGRPTVANLRISEQVNVQGDTEWYALHAVWDAGGDYDHAQVWAGRDGSELRLVDGNAVGSRSSFRIDGAGEWLVEVRPFNASGLVGQSAAVLYITTMTQIAPRNVDDFVVQEVAGGLRRFAWQYTGDRPPAFAGVQIRYLPGNVLLSVADWDGMQPLGEAGDVYRAQFETTRPQAGQWTFGCRAIDTAGQLANGVVRFVANLGDSFEQVQQPDPTPPPPVTGLAAVAAFSSVMVSWDVPIYTEGHGHARTEVWAAPAPDLAQASQVAEAYAGPVSFSSDVAATWHIWARNVTTDGVAGAFAGPVTAQTGADVAGLLEVLGGQVGPDLLSPIIRDKVEKIDRIDFDRIDVLNEISIPQLEEIALVDLGRIDLIDKEGGPLGKSLLTAAAQQDALNQQVRGGMEDMAKGLLEAALAADAALERITDAGVYVDPATGQVKIYGLETTNTQVTSLQLLLDALSGQLQLKATTAYVDGKIAQAVLSPADLLLYEGLDARLVNVVQELDGINGTLSSKAEALELQDAVARLTTAESNLDALGGQIALRVTRAEYEAAQGALQERLGSAELTLSALDVPSISATVTAVSKLQRDADKTAQALLQDILTGERDRVQASEALAFARNVLTASIQDGLAAEAEARTQLAATVGEQAAALTQEALTRATADAAEASQREGLAATVQGNQQQATAALEAERVARVDGDSAEAAQRAVLRAEMLGETDALAALLEEEATVRATADAAEASARQQLTTRLDGADAALGAQVGEERVARIAADAAEASAREALAARLDGTNEDLAAQVTEEQAARVGGDLAEAVARQSLAAQVERDQQALHAQVIAESQARADGDSAEAAARQQLAAVVEEGQQQLQAQVTAEQRARADADSAETSSRESQISASRALSEKEGERAAQALLQDIFTGERNKAEADAALALAKTELSTQIKEGLSAEALQRTQLAAAVGQQAAALEQEQRVRADGDSAEATARQQLAAQVEQEQQALQAQVTAESQARADGDSAEASARQQLAAAVGDDLAAVEQQFSAQAGVNGYLAAKYSLAVQVGQGGQTVVGGMQITGSSEGGEGPKIAIAFATDAFSIVSTDGTLKSTPFYVQPTDMTINGVVVPAGAYMDSARIGNVDAILGRFGTLFADKVQATELSASQLTAGNGVIGGTLKSANYMTGDSGWALRPDGVAEFSGVIVRGAIYATVGTIGSITINGGGLNAGGYSGHGWPPGNSTGFHLGPNGLLMGNPSVGRYVQITESGNIYMPGFNVNNGNATFSGALSGATGSFSGSLTAQAINAVRTVNIAGNAVTVPSAHSGAGYSAAVAISLDVAAPVLVIATFFGQQISWFTPVVRRNGIEIFRGNGFSSGGVNPTIPVTITGVDYPGAGVHTYTVGNVGDGASSSTTISVIGVKR